jgi:hypothetical protein
MVHLFMDLGASPLNDLVGIPNELGKNAELGGRAG